MPDGHLEQLFTLYAEDRFEAFEQIYPLISGGIETYLRRRLHDDESIAEVMQESFLKLHHYRNRYDSKYLAWQWIYVITRSELRAYKNKYKGRLREDEFQEHLSQSEDNSTNTLMKDELETAFEQLDGETRELLRDKFILEHTYDEIAERLGVNSSSLRQKASRVLRALKKTLLNEGEDSDEKK